MNREVVTLLRLEGFVFLVLGVVTYAQLEWSWWLFGLLFLVPDISMVGYLKDAKVGASTYNAAHTYFAPGLAGALAYWLGMTLLGQIALIWAAHIAFDRLLGFGLKLPLEFRSTHLGIQQNSS